MKYFAPSKLRSSVLRGLAVGSLACSFAFSQQAMAQEQETAEDTSDVERIITTGSRIARDPNLASPSPIQAIDAEAIQQSGEFSITDIVNDVPALFSSVGAESSKDNGTDFADGANVLNLRGMGSARTLVLVNGRRHVAGVEGTGAVDVGSIPTKLIKSVEVMTGGASAVYGADAVTGVVNFILKDDFEGFEFDVQTGQSSEGDAEQTSLAATYGFNFDNDRGNLVLSLEYGDDQGLKAGERDGGVFIGSGAVDVNPAFRFQQGEIGGSTPTFAQFFNPSNGLGTFGALIPTDAEDFLNDFETAFGTRPTLNSAEMALIARASNAFGEAIVPGYAFGLTSGYGVIGPGNGNLFTGFELNTNIDLDNNGLPDCYDSATGVMSGDVFQPSNSQFLRKYYDTFGTIGGCWNVLENGTYRPIRDGVILNNVNSGFGDGFNAIQQTDGYVLLPEEKVSVNLIGSYDLTDDARLTTEIKYAKQEIEDVTQPTSFWDLLTGYPDNPFLPEFIRPIAQQTAGVSITVDPIAIGNGLQQTERETMRFVLALDGYMDNGWSYQTSAVWGRFERETTADDNVIVDRFFAAIDAVTGPDGSPACRHDIDPGADITTTPFNLPNFDAGSGFLTFTPGAGQCVPLNIWAGRSGVTQEALDWLTVTTTDSIKLEQTVLSGSLAGDLGDYFELPAGPIAFAIGAEYREEKSEAIFDAWQRGVLPSESLFAGQNIEDVSLNKSPLFDPSIPTRNEVGEYDVTELFIEAQIPLLDGVTLADELTLELAARFSDYSSIGQTTTWKANVLWSPTEDLRIRTSISEAVRAPNVTELFGPTTGTTVGRQEDICDESQASTANLQNNCETDLLAAGVEQAAIRDANGNYIWQNPLTARFSGTTSGNAELTEETADTLTVGFVYRPSWFDGFDITVDYWSIELEDAINEVDEAIIIETCYSGASLNPLFCDLFTRISDPNNAQVGGLNFIRNQPINFAKRETDGYDFSASYKFSLEDHDFGITLAGTKVNELNDFTNPTDLTEVDPELGEVNRPEWAGNIYLDWSWGDLKVAWQTQYMGEQGVTGAEIEDIFGQGFCVRAECTLGPEIIQDEFWQHDISANYTFSDEFMVYGGIKNLTDEEPFITEFAYPASPRGRYFFVGLNYRM